MDSFSLRMDKLWIFSQPDSIQREITLHALLHILARDKDQACLFQIIQPAVSPRGDLLYLASHRRRSKSTALKAGIAVSLAFFSAVHVMFVRQLDERTDEIVIMQRHDQRHMQSPMKRQHPRLGIKQVFDMDHPYIRCFQKLQKTAAVFIPKADDMLRFPFFVEINFDQASKGLYKKNVLPLAAPLPRHLKSMARRATAGDIGQDNGYS